MQPFFYFDGWSIHYVVCKIYMSEVESKNFLRKAKLRDHNSIWHPSLHPYVKINVDGSWNEANYEMGGGGVDNVGRWLFDYSINLGFRDALLAELGGVLVGLEFCWERGHESVVCESDCLHVVSMFECSQHQHDELRAYRRLI